jgi:hypothetical protein
MSRTFVALLLLFAASDAFAQAQPEAKRALDQAATVLAQARRCPQLITKAEADKFAARATAVVARADNQHVARGSSGEYEAISSPLIMATNCKMVGCPGKEPAILPPNCPDFAKIFKGLRINQPTWQLSEGIR